MYKLPQISTTSSGLLSSRTRCRFFGIESAIPSFPTSHHLPPFSPSLHSRPIASFALRRASRSRSAFIARGWLLFISRIFSAGICPKMLRKQSSTFLSAQNPQSICIAPIPHLLRAAFDRRTPSPWSPTSRQIPAGCDTRPKPRESTRRARSEGRIPRNGRSGGSSSPTR